MPRGDLREAGRFFAGDADPGYPDFLMLVAEWAGLVRPENGAWRLSPDGPDRLEETRDILATALSSWKATDRWNEWSADRTVSSGRSGRSEELSLIRGEVLDGLSRCKVGAWVAYPQFYRLLAATTRTFRELSEGAASPRSASRGGTTADELLRRLLTGALAWMGVVDLGAAGAFARPLHHDAGACFRLTPLGSGLLSGRPREAPPPGIPTVEAAKFVIQPNLEVLGPPELPRRIHMLLCSLADVLAIDVVARFQITRDGILDALNRGWTGKEVRAFLEEHSATGVPHMVEALIAECDAKHGEIELRPASGFLTTGEPRLLDELLAQKAVADLLDRRLGPCVAAVRAGIRSEALAQVLSRQGYMPRVDADGEHAADGQLRISLQTSDLSELVAFLESSMAFLEARTGDRPADIEHLSRRLRRSLRAAPAEQLDRLRDRYGKAFARVATAAPAADGPRKLSLFDGANPADTPDGLRSLLGYAIENRLCVRLFYGAPTLPERIVQPASDDDQMLYAFCRARRGDRVFRYDRIRRAELTAETF
jgi:hypothetical protein